MYVSSSVASLECHIIQFLHVHEGISELKRNSISSSNLQDVVAFVIGAQAPRRSFHPPTTGQSLHFNHSDFACGADCMFSFDGIRHWLRNTLSSDYRDSRLISGTILIGDLGFEVYLHESEH